MLNQKKYSHIDNCLVCGKIVSRYSRSSKTIINGEAHYIHDSCNWKNETIEKGIVIEDEVCSEFGCPTKLSITEKLCGSKCLRHQ